MKLTIERAALLKSLGHVQSVVERRNTIPILSNIKLEAADGRLGLNATDMDLDIVESVAAEITSPGATTVPAHTLYDIVRKLPEGSQVEFDGDDGQLRLSSGRSRFTLASLPTDDFPVLGADSFPLTANLVEPPFGQPRRVCVAVLVPSVGDVPPDSVPVQQSFAGLFLGHHVSGADRVGQGDRFRR